MKRGLFFILAFSLARCASAPRPGELPVVELGARGDAESQYFAVFLTGDGGWRKIDIKVSDVLRANGVPVVGLLMNRYFAHERTEEQTAADIDRLLREYQAKWQRPKALLIGYSRGADTLPFVVNRLPDSTRQMVSVIALLGPALKAGLSIKGPDRVPLLPELKQMTGLPLVCVYGTLEKESLCRSFAPGQGTVLSIKGGHHFGGDYDQIGRAILDAAKRGP